MEGPTVEREAGGPTVAAVHGPGIIGGAVFGPAGPLAV